MNFDVLDELTLDLIRSAAIRHGQNRLAADSHFNRELSDFTRLADLALALGHTFKAALAGEEETQLENLLNKLIELSTTAAIWVDVLNRCTCKDIRQSTCFRHRAQRPPKPKYEAGTPIVITDQCPDPVLRGLTGRIKLISTKGGITYYVVLDLDESTWPLKENEIRSTLYIAKPPNCTCHDTRLAGALEPDLIPGVEPCPIHPRETEEES